MHRSESTDSGKDDDLQEAFGRVIAKLSDGDLTFQAPFDLASSAALAANMDSGELAAALFRVTQSRETNYRVHIAAVVPDLEPRDVVNTTVSGEGLLVALLEGLIDEILSLQERREGNPCDG